MRYSENKIIVKNKFLENKTYRGREWMLDRLPKIFTKTYMCPVEAADTIWWLYAYEDEVAEMIDQIDFGFDVGGTNLEFVFSMFAVLVSYWEFVPQMFNRDMIPMERWDFSWMFPLSPVGVTAEALLYACQYGHRLLTARVVTFLMDEMHPEATVIRAGPVRKIYESVLLSSELDVGIAETICLSEDQVIAVPCEIDIEIPYHDAGKVFEEKPDFFVPNVELGEVSSILSTQGPDEGFFVPLDYGLVVPASSVEIAWMNYSAYMDIDAPIFGHDAHQKFLTYAYTLLAKSNRSVWCAEQGLEYDGVFDNKALCSLWFKLQQPPDKWSHDKELMAFSGFFLIAWWEGYLRREPHILLGLAYGICRAFFYGGSPLFITPVILVQTAKCAWEMPAYQAIPLFEKRFKTQLPAIPSFKEGVGPFNAVLSIDAGLLCEVENDVLKIPLVYLNLLSSNLLRGVIINVYGPDECVDLLRENFRSFVKCSRLPLGYVWEPPQLPPFFRWQGHFWTAVSFFDTVGLVRASWREQSSIAFGQWSSPP